VTIILGGQGFGGIIPSISADKLPENAAQTAHGCKLYQGTIAPLTTNAPFQLLHDNDDAMLSDVPSSEQKAITKGVTPTKNNTPSGSRMIRMYPTPCLFGR
jgi:hypothetical protein